MSPKAQGLVSNTHHSKTCMVKHHTHDRMSGGKTTKRHNSGSVGKKTTSSDETNHAVVSLLPTEEDSSRMSGGKGEKPMNSGSAVKKTTFSDETNHAAVSLLPKKEDSSRWVSTLVPLTLLTAASIHAVKLNENRMLYNVSDATKVQMVGYYLTQMKGQTLDILWVFSSVKNFYHHNFLDTVHGRKSSHLMASSHSGFFLFYHYNLQGSCLQTVIQPHYRDCGSPHIVGFAFLTTNHTNLNGSTRWGSPIRPPSWAESLILTVHRLGLIPQRHTHGSESLPIVQGLVQDLNVYKTHGV